MRAFLVRRLDTFGVTRSVVVDLKRKELMNCFKRIFVSGLNATRPPVSVASNVYEIAARFDSINLTPGGTLSWMNMGTENRPR